MLKRRTFLTRVFGSTLTFSLLTLTSCRGEKIKKITREFPVLISTWDHGLVANEAGWKALQSSGNALDAVEIGVSIVEADEKGRSVGIGGRPDRDGNVTLDACIMDHLGNCGSVCFLEGIKHPISVARKVMEETPHVMLAGSGAKAFAIESGFPVENLLTTEVEKEWNEWLRESEYNPIINTENHDTIGMLAIDTHGNISGACTTSGLAYKMRGRVGDSPIIGAGLYVDNEVGGACATGLGEEIIKKCASFLVVELMRMGRSPEDACKETIQRIASKKKNENFQVGLIALNKQGETGAYALRKGFNYAEMDVKGNQLIDAASIS